MLELIAIVGGLVLCFYLPYEANKVRNGWVRKRFKGAPEDFRPQHAKLLRSFMILGLVIGAANIVLAPLNLEGGEWVFKLVDGIIWLAVAAIAYNLRAKMALQTASPQFHQSRR